MEDSKSVVPSGAYGIPKWIMKKGMRYEVDDFIVSPPSLDDGGFLRLRYGRACSPQKPDGGMTVEVKDDTLQFSPDTTPTSTTISIGPGGFSVEPSPATTPLTTPETKAETSDVHPLLVLPMNIKGEPKFIVKVEPPDSPKTNTESLGPTAAPASKELSTTTSLDCIANQNNTLLEKVQSLSLATTPSHSVPTSPVTSPFTTPKNSPILGRKCVVGVAMEPQRKISAHSYFCTKQLQDNQGSISAAVSSLKEEVSVNTKQLEEGAIVAPKVMGQRRRHPKPSALREMNFWAPTSM
ncbi:uncharacterized protein LOC123507527 isoform X1 [Portunus trituberculatus]|uniref:uncharacterized protein LOC123507527 isoform X1 n=1 Tax=Portunus trituberculatus TaxID=210409 RepID=UPI001E1D1D8E|nr:uncharacterized protein LOC123507527 isoform X1 [Portunus trituberculatus]XP_045116380.1 uncharacterized protein LOC123507527 isoform X1 [Portunus trituberculatus]XP_045116381.1 uncharacterized protein LOC123507527 isoform X1 [Portunus trituberculatus]